MPGHPAHNLLMEFVFSFLTTVRRTKYHAEWLEITEPLSSSAGARVQTSRCQQGQLSAKERALLCLLATSGCAGQPLGDSFGLRVRHCISAPISQGLRPCVSVKPRFPLLTRVPGTDLEPTLIQADLILPTPAITPSVLTRPHAQVPGGRELGGTLLSPRHLGLEPGLYGLLHPCPPQYNRARSCLCGRALWPTFPSP